MTDYRKLRLSNILSPEYRHILLLIYWPLYGATFFLLEADVNRNYIPVECWLDSKIPFCEYFMIPYLMWFVYLVWIHIYTLFADVKEFKKLIYYVMIINTAAIIIFILFPSKQELRPTEFPRDNFFTETVKAFYNHDTNTNVCPSLHVTGAIAVLFASWKAKGLDNTICRVINIVLTFFISISTVFLKQHSAIDVIAGVILCIIAWPFVYVLPQKLKRQSKVDKKEKITSKK